MWISRKRLDKIKKDAYGDGFNKGFELGLRSRSRRVSKLRAIRKALNHMNAVAEAERIVRGL